MTVRAASHVDEERLWQRHMRMAQHGATPRGGTNRQALSPEEFAARKELIEWGRATGASPRMDAAGNLFLRLEGADSTAAPVLTGSHLDSQPTGGNFDGVFGVLAGLEALSAIVKSGIRIERSIEVVAWTNEEGSRFAPGMMGSAAFAGAASLEAFLPVTDARGVSVAEALTSLRGEFPEVPAVELKRPVHAYVEAHIEQGPLLERAGRAVGVVSGIQGKRTFRVTVSGEEAHCGTTARRERRDALIAAVNMVAALDSAMRDDRDEVKFTVGRFDVSPNAPSVVAARAIFSIDLRHPDSSALTTLGDLIPSVVRAHAGPCDVEVTELTTAMSLEFPQEMRRLIRDKAHVLGIEPMDIFSAAGHDARYLHGVCPTGMIFVPCKDGISHNEAESANASDLAAGARVLTEVLLELAKARR